MTLRTSSRVRQWTLWAVEALVAAAAYVVVVNILFGGMQGDIASPYSQRVLLPVVAVFLLVAWETRWDGVVRTAKPKEVRPRHHHSRRKEGDVAPHVQPSAKAISRPTSEAEAIYVAARKISHQRIPNYVQDTAYMEMLGKAAQAGHDRALSKLGEYAMRRHEWVEAYYWLWLAQRNGARNLELSLRKVRRRWVKEGFPGQGSNVNALFTKERGSIGWALLCALTGHDAQNARKFLKEKNVLSL